MRAFVRHGHPAWPIPCRPHQVDDIAEFVRLEAGAAWQRRYIQSHRNKKLRELIGPPEFDGPEHDGKRDYVGEIINGRVYNGVTHLYYLCIRGMSDETFRSDVECMHRYVDHMKRCSGPRLPP